MSGSLRWGDSDSSDEDEILVSTLLRQEREGQSDVAEDTGREEKPSSLAKALSPTYPTPQPSRSQRTASAGTFRPKVGGAKSYHRTRSGGSLPSAPRQEDWKEMAKSASRFGPAVETSQSVDGSAWMAQRRARQQKQEEENRVVLEERQKQEVEQKRQRRSLQLEALKAAVNRMDEANQSSGSSLLQASAKSTGVASGNSPSQPTKILRRPESNDDDSESVVSASTLNSASSRGRKGRGSDGGRGGRDGRGGEGGRGVVDSGGRTGRSEAGKDRRPEGRGRFDRNERGKNRGRAPDSGRGRGDRNDAGRGKGDTTELSTEVRTESNEDDGFKGSSHSGDRREGDGVAGRGRGRRGDTGRGRGGRKSGRGRGRGFIKSDSGGGRGSSPSSSGNVATVAKGKPQVVQTARGKAEYRFGGGERDSRTKGELLADGSVRLSKSFRKNHDSGAKMGKRGKGGKLVHSPIRTKIEIGKDDL